MNYLKEEGNSCPLITLVLMVCQTYTIYPTHKHNRQASPSTLSLHGLDLLSAAIQIRNHRFFHRPENSNSIDEIVENLKSSLAEALELYPPVAGTVKLDENNVPYIAIDINSPMGTPFTVETKDAPYNGDTEDLSARMDLVLPPMSSVFAVKVTQFSCGTVCVASSINHQVTDLSGYLDFLKLWARLARGEQVDFDKIPDDWHHTPSRFFTGIKTDSTRAPPPFRVLAPGSPVEPPQFLMASSHVSKWNFSKDKMEQLKRDFSPASSWISSGDALGALLAGVITRARQNANVPRLEGRSDAASQTEEIAMAADGRERSPHKCMTNGKYFGNFNALWSATVSRSDLLSVDPKASSRVALSIRNTLNVELSTEAVASKVAFFEDPKNTPVTWSADIIFTNWCRFDLQDSAYDLGWGKPFNATPGTGGVLPPGYCLMTQNNAAGKTHVVMTVEAAAAEQLMSDPVLRNYATQIDL